VHEQAEAHEVGFLNDRPHEWQLKQHGREALSKPRLRLELPVKMEIYGVCYQRIISKM